MTRTETDRRGISHPTFTDTAGRRWTIALDFEVYRRVLSNYDVDLCDIVYAEQKCLKALDNPITLVDVLYEIVKVEAIGRKVDEVAFAKALDMAVIVDAQRKLVDEMIFFSRSHPRAQIVREAVAAYDRAEREARQQVAQEMPRIRKVMAGLDLSALGDSGGSSPESSASTPESGPFDNSPGPQGSGSGKAGITPRASSRKRRKPTATPSAVPRRSLRESSTRSSSAPKTRK